MSRPRFHLAIPVHDLAAARSFYEGVLGCAPGRTASRWCDFDFQGHQLTAHLSTAKLETPTNPVDGHDVPAHHFGLILAWAEWEQLSEKLEAAGVDFLIRPTIRFRGRPGEQATLVVKDPSGNALEFKAFRTESEIFRNHG